MADPLGGTGCGGLGEASAAMSPTVIIEFCCAQDSQVGKVETTGLGGGGKDARRPGCRVVRITKEDCDVTTREAQNVPKTLRVTTQEPCF